MKQTKTAKPTATATIEPLGLRATVPREHSVNVTINLSEPKTKYANREFVARLASKSLEGFLPTPGQADRRRFSDLTVSHRAKTGEVSTVVVGVEGSLVCTERPGDDSVEFLHAALVAAGYRVVVEERRQCGEPDCITDAMVGWNHLSTVPSGWFSNLICGRHHYRACSTCDSLYRLSSEASSLHAPSVHCEVCGVVLIEWGGTKTWYAELVARGPAPSLTPERSVGV
jgi:hypothetical protein